MLCHVSQWRQTRKHNCGNIVSYQCFVMFPSVDELGNIFVRNIGSLCFVCYKLRGKLGNTVSASKMSLNLFVNIFAFREAKFCFRSNVSQGGQTGKHDGNSAVFPGLLRLKL